MNIRIPRTALRIGGLTLVSVLGTSWPMSSVLPSMFPEQGAELSPSDLWLAPSSDPRVRGSAFSEAIDQLTRGEAERALPVFAGATRDPLLGGYALLYQGRAQLELGRHEDAAFSARQLLSTSPRGHLGDAALVLAADAAEVAGDWKTVARHLETLAAGRPVNPERVHLRWGYAALKTGDVETAARAFSRVYYEFALTSVADEAGAELAKLAAVAPALPTAERVQLDFGRAQRLYGARRYADARKAFESVRGSLTGDDRRLVDLRLAQIDYYLKRHAAARDALRAYIDNSRSRLPEAQYFYLSTIRELGRTDEYLALVRSFVDGNPQEPLAETALNDLGTYYILQNDDAKAAEVFAELFRRFRNGVYAERAAWKAGWWSYKSGEYAVAAQIFSSAATAHPRSDYRPAWLYWTARAYAHVGDHEAADAAFRAVIGDYRNSYYGREAARELAELRAAKRPNGAGEVTPASRTLPPSINPGPRPPNATLLQALLAAGLYSDAIAELRKVQLESGTSPFIEATLAYALNREGSLRPAITAMRRAYPQFMAAGGEALPTEMLEVIFPIAYWDLIQKYSAAHKLDPFLMAALMAQESTFQAEVKSVANAYGLMQILPSTGRRYAQTMGIRPFSTPRLTEPEVNTRIGMQYFADLVRMFGHVAPALAAYNAGENRVSRWLAERPGVDLDEFIDDIPFPETQNYVKRIIGTAEDYRILYRDLKAVPAIRR